MTYTVFKVTGFKFEDTTAVKIGFKAGDYILKVNGEHLANLETLQSTIRANTGQDAEFTVLRCTEEITLKGKCETLGVNLESLRLEDTLVKSYVGKEIEATEQFQKDSKFMASLGYYPVNQQYTQGSYGVGAFLIALFLCFFFFIGILAFIFMLIVKPAGSLTVTYKRRESEASPAAARSDEKICPDCAEPVKAEAKICRYCRHSFSE
uniref:PDZ domain-containing protein n=1 Tax=Shewanella putrefaciens (strain 200) TaxID=399804 RepID=E6XSF7_SHEP2